MKYEEHDKRAWSVDFSRADPTKLASGSDDCCVKLWSINQVNTKPRTLEFDLSEMAYVTEGAAAS